MKKYLLPQSGRFYKANLHCHSTVSDGRWSPEEIKKRYMEKGYSIVAYTDHDVFILHNELTDKEFLALNGIEYGFNNGVLPKKLSKNCDIGMIALKHDTVIQPCWHRKKYMTPGCTLNFKPFVRFDESKPDFERIYTPECINRMIKEGVDSGFFVTYNHPTWSNEEYTDYINYNGMHAMEICNYGCVASGNDEHNTRIYEEMLKSGKRLLCTATDDNHNKYGEDDSFGGFTVIKAEKLEYETITNALLRGEYYSSEGPVIDELWYEDGMVHITFEPAKLVFTNKMTRNISKVSAPDGEFITEATFAVEDDDGYFRITVVGADGKRAYTNAYFLDDILEK
ncbi:MAG: PHP domain-containing protein [Ruminococcaceae bacterium]|nr:PHP domain-containing protein [Oscillospiraceae bacterium]